MEHIVIKLIHLRPQPNAFVPDIVHRFDDAEKMLEELGRDVLVNIVVPRQFEGDAHQV